MALVKILSYIQNAPKEEILMYNKILDLAKTNMTNSEDPCNPDDYKILKNILINKNTIWYDIIYGKYGFFDKIYI